MFRSRRTFLGLAAASAALAMGAPLLARQADDDGGDLPHDPLGLTEPLPRPDPRVLLAANQKSLKKDVSQLSDIVRQMQKQLEQSDTKDFLPLDVLHDTDEIEKLAKHIRSLVVG